MNRRMVVTLLCLAGIFISAYLWMYKLGLLGTIACGTGGCETVQLSPQSRFLGIEVALIGLVGYVILFGLALASLQPGLAAKRWPVQLLAVLSGGAVLFTAYLKFLEFFVIHAICRWCVASAVIIATVFVLSLLEVRALPSKA
jgi:uncharacterized membrane protein